MATFYGKYRAVVVANEDPMRIGRVQVSVPDVLMEGETAWAMPCAPPDGGRMGSLAIPAVGSNVWIEFERGDRDFPIWSGVWWSSADETPAVVVGPPFGSVTITTASGHALTLEDLPGIGGIRLETPRGERIVIGDTGIEISNGKGASIRLVGPTVSVNDGALAVT